MTEIATFQQFDTGVALRAPNVSVQVDRIQRGEVQASWQVQLVDIDFLVPGTLTLGTNGSPSVLKLGLALRDTDGFRAVRNVAEYGDRVRLLVRYGQGQVRELFRGYVGQVGINYAPNTNGSDFEGTGLVAYGVEVLDAPTILTQWYTPAYEDSRIAAGPLGAGQSHPFEVDATDPMFEPPIFNPGEGFNRKNGNATPEDDAGLTYFMHPGRVIKNASGDIIMQAEPWTAYTAARELLNSFIGTIDNTAADENLTSNLDGLKAVLDVIPISQVDVTGIPLLVGLAKVLNPVGYGFHISPGTFPTADGGLPERVMTFYRLGGTAPVPGPWMGNRKTAVTMSSEEGQRIQLTALSVNFSAKDAVNDWTVFGDHKRDEVGLIWDGTSDGDLQAAWDTVVHSLDDFDVGGELNEFSVVTPQTFRDNYNADAVNFVRHAFRSFAWNEDAGMAPRITAIPDLTDYSDDANNNIRRPRNVGKSIVYDDSATQRFRPSKVELGIWTNPAGTKVTDANAWVQIPASIWRDRAGFTLTAKNLLNLTAYKRSDGDEALADKYEDLQLAQLLYNTMHVAGNSALPRAQFRLTGSIATDDRVTTFASQQQGSAWPFQKQGVVYAPQRFKWNEISDAALTGDERDDRAAAEAYAEARRDVSEDAVAQGSMMLRGIDLVYEPGMVIAETRGYVIDLRVNAGGGVRRAPTVVGVNYDFTEGDIKTEILLDTRVMGRIR